MDRNPGLRGDSTICSFSTIISYVLKESEVTIRVYEIHTFIRKPRVATMQYRVSEVEDRREAEIGSDNPTYAATVLFDHRPEGDAATTALAQAQAQAVNRQHRVLQNIGPARDAIKAILAFGGAVAEAAGSNPQPAQLNPTVNGLLDICNRAWQKLEAQDQCDESVETLVAGLSSILPHVAGAEKAAKLPELQVTVGNLLHLIEDASSFIIEYRTEGQTGVSACFYENIQLSPIDAGQLARALASSIAQARVDTLLQHLQKLKEEFDRGMGLQTLLDGQNVVSFRACYHKLTAWNNVPGQRTLLDQLNPVGKARYDPARACLAGTRTDIIDNITAWCESSNDPNHLLWVHGQAGLGKSTIATSICQKLDGNLLAASFFCKRDDQERRDPQRVLTTIIRGLAHRHHTYAKALATAIRDDSSICTAPMETQYKSLVVDLFKRNEVSAETGSFVVVVDALDECGDAQTRRRLLGYLHNMSRLVNWLKVVITSRPDQDIKGYFDLPSSLQGFSARDVRSYDASDDIHRFVHQRLRDSPNAASLPADAGPKLAEKANGLFIWAQTACEFVLSGFEPSHRLELLLEKNSTVGALDVLYSTAIEASIGDGGDDNLQSIRQCLGAIIACSARTPLSIPTLCEILGGRIKQHVLTAVVDSLRSVLYVDETQGGAVRVYHPSFADYLGTRAPSDRLFVDIPKRNAELAEGCLETMVAQLKFNICEIKTSYVRNKDMPSLDESVAKAISNGLRYSAEYWANHLVKAEKRASISQGGELLSQLLDGPRILYWVETLSLIGKLHIALPSLRELKRWCEGTPHRALLNDLERFIQIFYTPISESTPHLYISGLAFLPIKTSLAEMLHIYFRRTIKCD
ncbi:hypothetical protein FRC06_007336 [Ceratobasidium sp. 370]|nr:hypothetical protein FRC06_007336 [Ceratobasidium sp. 370]